MNRTVAGRHYLGSANADVWHADLETTGLPGVRTIVNRDVEALYEKLTRDGCHREDYRHHATAVISRTLWSSVLSRTGITAASTRDPCQQLAKLEFIPTERFKCVQGRLRVSAARLFENRDDQWWSFDFYSDAIEEEDLWTLRTHCPSNSSFTDGDIYRNLRYCQLNAPSMTTFWLAQLSEPKSTDFDQLSRRHPQLQRALDALIPYVGEWQDFPLGAFHRLLTTKANEVRNCVFLRIGPSFTHDQEMIRYLERLKQQLAEYIPSQPENLDTETVRLTAMLCPAIDLQDRVRLNEMLRCDQIFQYFPEDERHHLVLRLSNVQGRILSLRSFVSDTIQTEISSMVLRHILPKLNVDANIEQLFRDRFDWSTDTVQIETSEGQYATYSASHLDADARFRLCYIQLWMWAGRNFNRITDRAPKRNSRSKKPSPEYNEAAPYMLAVHAQRVGFSAPEIAACVAKDPFLELTRSFLRKVSEFRGCDLKNDESLRLLMPSIRSLVRNVEKGPASPDENLHTFEDAIVPRANRCGVPLGSMLEWYRKRLFLPLLGSAFAPTPTSRADPIHIVRDIFDCFFGCVGAEVDSVLNRGAVGLARNPAMVTCAGQARYGRYLSPSQLLHSHVGQMSPSSVYSDHQSGERSAGHASSQDIPSYYYVDAGMQDTSDSAEAQPEGRWQHTWFAATEIERIPSQDLQSYKFVLLLPDTLLHTIEMVELSPIADLARDQHAFLISDNGKPRYVDFSEVRECLIQEVPLIFAQKKSDQRMFLSESVFASLELVIGKLALSTLSAAETLTFKRPVWAYMFGER